MSTDKPISILIAAMGGEGGGVLAGWITEAANAAGLWTQRTSIPGVAQRTGATTYYIEMVPKQDSRRPILALNPAPGQVDVVLSTELLEAVRAAQGGLITPDRTLLIASSHRVFTIAEKMAMGDGRLDSTRLEEVARRCARQTILTNLEQVASEAGSHLNAVVLGVLAASGALPIPTEAFRQAIESGGKAVSGNLRGFEAGLRVSVSGPEPVDVVPLPIPSWRGGDALEDAAARLVPGAGVLAVEGVRRLADYQGRSYARLYLDRLSRFAGRPGVDAAFMDELARHLAVRMSFEDTIRVAQLKLRESRIRTVDLEARAKPGDVVHITEFLKPGPEEILSLLPPRLAAPALRFCERRGLMERSLPMKVRTTSLSGFFKLKVLSALKPMRPSSLRYRDEQAWIETWLGLIEEALAKDPAAAAEIVQTARLVKGYGETYRRGHANWRKIHDGIIRPMLSGQLPALHFADAVMQARIAALADPEGRRLDDVIEGVRRMAPPLTGVAAE